MIRNASRSQFVLPLVLGVTAVVAFLPVDWRLGWSRELAEFVRFPLRPFTHAGNAAGGFLRPAQGEMEGVDDIAAHVTQLVEDRDVARRLYHRERQRVLELEEENRQLQRIPEETRRYALKSLIAPVTLRSPNEPEGVVEVKPRGVSAMSVTTGTVAVYAGVHVVGRTLEVTSRAACPILPITNRETGFIQARLVPRDAVLTSLEDCPLIQLQPEGDGTFVADVRRLEILAEGDIVQLDDSGWPPTAQQMIIGRVTRIETNEREPLRNRLTVEPVYPLRQVAYVTLIIEDTTLTSEVTTP